MDPPRCYVQVIVKSLLKGVGVVAPGAEALKVTVTDPGVAIGRTTTLPVDIGLVTWTVSVTAGSAPTTTL
jgi:hypothetical protein